MPLVPSPLRDVVRAQSVSGGKASRAYAVLQTMCGFTKLFAGGTARPDLDALVSSGIFEQCLGIVHAFERAGVERLGDASPAVLQMALCLIKYLRSHRDCEVKIRGLGSGLAFAMEHSLDIIKVTGFTTGASATQICELLPHQNASFRVFSCRLT